MAVSAAWTPLGFLPRLSAGTAAGSFRTQPQQGDFMGNGEGRRRRVSPFPWPPSRSSSSTALRRLEDGGFQSSSPDCSSEKTLCERDEATHWDYYSIKSWRTSCFLLFWIFSKSRLDQVPKSLLPLCFVICEANWLVPENGGFIIVLLDEMNLKVIFFISKRKERRMISRQVGSVSCCFSDFTARIYRQQQQGVFGKASGGSKTSATPFLSFHLISHFHPINKSPGMWLKIYLCQLKQAQ